MKKSILLNLAFTDFRLGLVSMQCICRGVRAVLSLHSTLASTSARDQTCHELINQEIHTDQNRTVFREISASQREQDQLIARLLKKHQLETKPEQQDLPSSQQSQGLETFSPQQQQNEIHTQLRQIKEQQAELGKPINQHQEKFALKVGEILGESAVDTFLKTAKQRVWNVLKSKQPFGESP